MRVLVTTFPGHGHFHPLVPVALALQDRSHEVLVATGPDLVDWVAACELAVAPAGLTQAQAVHLAKERVGADGRYAQVMFTDIAPRAMLADLDHLAARFHPDLVMHEEAEFAGPILAARLEVPVVTHSWAAPAVPPAVRESATAMLAPLWRDHVGRPARWSGDWYLDACPPPFQTPDAQTIPGRIAIRPTAYDGPPQAADPALDDLPRPTAYVGFGTVDEFSKLDRLVAAAAAVSREVPAVVLATGPNQPTAVVADVPHNVIVRRYVPLNTLLLRSEVVISHGGAGTTLAALLAGVPHLVLPQGAPSQTRTGHAVDIAGVGIALSGDAQSPERIREAVRALLDNRRYANRAEALARDLRSYPAPAMVAEMLESRFDPAAK